MFPKIVGFPPKSSHFNRCFHDFHHPFWRKKSPIFWEIPIYCCHLSHHRTLWFEPRILPRRGKVAVVPQSPKLQVPQSPCPQPTSPSSGTFNAQRSGWLESLGGFQKFSFESWKLERSSWWFLIWDIWVVATQIYFLLFTPNPGDDDPVWRRFFKWVGSTTN